MMFESDNEFIPDEDTIPHINVVLTCDNAITKKELLIPSKFSLSLMKVTQALRDTGADDCATDNPFILHDLHLFM